MEPSAFSEQPNPGHRRRRNWGGTDLNIHVSAICQRCVMRASADCQRRHGWILISGQDSLIHPKNVVMFDKMKGLFFWFSQHTLDDIILLPPWVWAGSGLNLDPRQLLKMIISDLFRTLLPAVRWGQTWNTFSVRIPWRRSSYEPSAKASGDYCCYLISPGIISHNASSTDGLLMAHTRETKSLI